MYAVLRHTEKPIDNFSHFTAALHELGATHPCKQHCQSCYMTKIAFGINVTAEVELKGTDGQEYNSWN